MDAGFNHFFKMRIKQLFIEHSLSLSLILMWLFNFYFIKWFVGITGFVVSVIIYIDILFKMKKRRMLKSEYLLMPFRKIELLKYVVLEKIFLTFITVAVFSIFMFSMVLFEKYIEIPKVLALNYMFLLLTASIGISIVQAIAFLKHTYEKKKNIQRFCEVLRLATLILFLVFTIILIIVFGAETNYYFSLLALIGIVAVAFFVFVKYFDLLVLKEIDYFKRLSFNYLVDLPVAIVFFSLFLFYLTNEEPKKVEPINTIKTIKSQ